MHNTGKYPHPCPPPRGGGIEIHVYEKREEKKGEHMKEKKNK
jgi:hypothetical protein